ncbi:hypothetical protein N177_1924 [Lutibaculum baratangense AMV1]|uniref:Mobile element protein n=1 Tax=Lutibaculum baratangense AMV1 TaxID=631454 RepID=V4TGD5_9HYPH|nr:hypothetical protein N177_1924 [Lutibaculum baratangense AMV1]
MRQFPLKVECVRRRVIAMREEALRDLFADIQGFFDSRRLYPATGWISPADIEKRRARPVCFPGQITRLE